MVKRLWVIFIAVILMFSFSDCSSSDKTDAVSKLSFKAASGYDYLKTLDGTQVTISGYMATSSPVLDLAGRILRIPLLA